MAQCKQVTKELIRIGFEILKDKFFLLAKTVFSIFLRLWPKSKLDSGHYVAVADYISPYFLQYRQKFRQSLYQLALSTYMIFVCTSTR